MTNIIVNGGSELPKSDCPKDWTEAEKIEQEFNKDKSKELEPNWSFDCGFKLDFDGPVVNIISRFYPPKELYGPGWDGKLTLMLGGDDIELKEFQSPSLVELRKEVESYLEELKVEIFEVLKEKFKPKE